jgi:hypothetical protein
VPAPAEREAEAVRRVLPELRKLNRYEARTYATRDRALSEVAAPGASCTMKPHAFAERTQSSRQIRPLTWGAAPRSPMQRSPGVLGAAPRKKERAETTLANDFIP